MKLNVCKYTKYHKYVSPLFVHYKELSYFNDVTEVFFIVLNLNMTCTLPKLFHCWFFITFKGSNSLNSPAGLE